MLHVKLQRLPGSAVTITRPLLRGAVLLAIAITTVEVAAGSGSGSGLLLGETTVAGMMAGGTIGKSVMIETGGTIVTGGTIETGGTTERTAVIGTTGAREDIATASLSNYML